MANRIAVNNNINSMPQNGNLFTYHLPYGVRKNICNLLDADHSWKTLGGQFVGLDGTQLALIGQAFMRNGSPSDELFNKMDSFNIKVSELYYYLAQMNHCRALEILKPYTFARAPSNGGFQEHATSVCYQSRDQSASMIPLHTPTPSFGEIVRVPAILGSDEPMQASGTSLEESIPSWIQNQNRAITLNQRISPPSNCHGPQNQNPNQQFARNNPQKTTPVADPGEEVVRKACENNSKRTSISDQEVVNQLRLIMQINYNELKLASNGFSQSNILGNGGFASVYRGNWKGTDVAIKRLKCNLMDQALNELTILNSYRIDNILPIYGISIDGPEACLVYQFMSNGSLEERLVCKGLTKPLSWSQRAQIGEGVAKGLYYLHTLRDKPLVHGDVKSANVLLDSQFVPKLGDFGLARQVIKGRNMPQPDLHTHCTVSSIQGTSVYLPPEYLRHKILSSAVDVYSYGTILLEMATGRRAYDGKRLLVNVVEEETRALSMGRVCYGLKDSRLTDESQSDLRIWLELLIKLGLDCAHKIKKKRPDMGQVLNRFAEFRADNLELASRCESAASNSSNGTIRTLTISPDLAKSTLRNQNKAQMVPSIDLSNVTGQPQQELAQQRSPQMLSPQPSQEPRLLGSQAQAVQPSLQVQTVQQVQTIQLTGNEWSPLPVQHQHQQSQHQQPILLQPVQVQPNNWVLMSVEEESELVHQYVNLMDNQEGAHQNLLQQQLEQQCQLQPVVPLQQPLLLMQNHEETNQMVGAPDGAKLEKRNQKSREDNQVEAMIPLLTELGIVAQQD